MSNRNETPLIKFVDVRKSYKIGPEAVPVLRGVSLELYPGEFVAIMGASGSGKSTLLHIAGALDRADEGSVSFDGRKVDEMFVSDRHRLRNQQMGFVFQFYHLLPELTVLENVLLPAMIDTPSKALVLFGYLPTILLGALAMVLFALGVFGVLVPISLLAGVAALVLAVLLFVGLEVYAFGSSFTNAILSRPSKIKQSKELLEKFGLTHRLKHRPNQLSGGERQRVAIARALINRPALLLADEPTGNLDAKTGAAIMDAIIAWHRERKQSILLVTHDPNIAKLADRTIHLIDGRVK